LEVFETEKNVIKLKPKNLKFEKTKFKPHLANRQLNFTMSKSGLKVLLKRKSNTTMIAI
jgi:hypothetical protein